jgi:hypothetical protein
MAGATSELDGASFSRVPWSERRQHSLQMSQPPQFFDKNCYKVKKMELKNGRFD